MENNNAGFSENKNAWKTENNNVGFSENKNAGFLENSLLFPDEFYDYKQRDCCH